MNSNKSNIELINIGIKKYTRKFYLFKILSGFLVSLSILAILYLTIVILQYFYFFSIGLKTVVFWGFMLTALLVLSEFVFFPLLRLTNILPNLSNYKAATNISSFYPEIKDKLHNILELSETNSDSKLLQASINQKISEIKLFDFSKVIKFNKLGSYAKYLVFPILILLLVLFYNKNILFEGNKKFVDYKVYYQPQAPFTFNLLNDDLSLQSGEDLQLNLQLNGDVLPDQVFVVFGNNKLPLIKNSKNKSIFNYIFKSVNKDFQFHFEALGFKSKSFIVSVLPSPSILNFTVEVNPPSYTRKAKFVLTNAGDMLIPVGTKLSFKFNVNSVDSLFIQIDSTNYTSQKVADKFIANLTAKFSTQYSIVVKNTFFTNEIFKYNLTVIPDLFPQIDISSIRDSVVNSKFYFHGLISDDYGINNLQFNYAILDNSSDLKPSIFKSIDVRYTKNILSQEFYYLFDFKDLQLSDNQTVNYYFSVTDNDGYLGNKTTKTQLFSFNFPTRQQIDSTVNQLDNQVQNKLKDAYQLADEIQLDIQSFNQKMINEDVSDWEQQNFLENLLQKQQMLNNMLDSMKQDNQDKINNLQQLKDKNDDLLKKQQQIQQMLEDLMTDEMKEMLDSLKKMQQDFDKDKFDKMMQNTQKNYDDLSKDLDKTQELLKRMQIEQQMQNTADKLQKMADELQKMAQNIDKQNDVTSAQEDSILTAKDEFDQLKDDYDSLMNKNNDLDKPYDLDSMNQDFDDVKKDFDDTKDNMFKNKDNKTSKSLQKTSQDMQKMADKMSQMMSANMQSGNAEDMQMIKFLLSNLLTFSFKQEDFNRTTLKNISIFSPQYALLQKNQLSLKDDFKIINDSLYALASRNPNIGSVITQELTTIRTNLTKSIDYLQAGQKQKASVNQRYVMTSANKLALMLQESLDQMQSQMSMPGSGKPKPGNQPQPSMGDLKQMQQGMKQQLEQMMQQMKNGQMPGSQQFGQQMAQREAFQKMLQDMMNNGDLTPQMEQMLKDMMKLNDDIKNDVINRNITPQTIDRDKKITTRLLEAENADNQRKISKQRQSNTTDDIMHTVPDNIQDLFQNSYKQNDILSKKSINLNLFLKQYYNGYIHRLAN